MKYFYLVFLLLVFHLALPAQVRSDSLILEMECWTTADVERIVDNNLSKVSRNSKHLISTYQQAKKEYDAILIFEARFDLDRYKKTGDIVYFLDQKKYPFDLFYFKGDKLKFLVNIGEDESISFYTNIATMYKGGGDLIKHALKKTRTQQPQYIFKGIKQATPFFYYLHGNFRVYDLLKKKDFPMEEYFKKYGDMITAEIQYWNHIDSVAKGWEQINFDYIDSLVEVSRLYDNK